MTALVDLWFATLDMLPDDRRGASDDELGRAARFRHDADRRRFLAGVHLLRAVVDDRVGDPSATIDRTCTTCSRQHGRPQVVGHALHVSVAHAGDVVVIAACAEAAVGVDVERLDAVGRDEVASITGFDGLVAAAGTPAQVWTRREAVLKASGLGFALDPRTVRCEADGSVTWSGPDARWVDVAVPEDVSSGYAAAVVWLRSEPVEVRYRDARCLFGLARS